MTHRKFRLPFRKTARRRQTRRIENHADVFKTFVHVLARIYARGAASPEKV